MLKFEESRLKSDSLLERRRQRIHRQKRQRIFFGSFAKVL
jgi:hypothetical protein